MPIVDDGLPKSNIHTRIARCLCIECYILVMEASGNKQILKINGNKKQRNQPNTSGSYTEIA